MNNANLCRHDSALEFVYAGAASQCHLLFPSRCEEIKGLCTPHAEPPAFPIPPWCLGVPHTIPVHPVIGNPLPSLLHPTPNPSLSVTHPRPTLTPPSIHFCNPPPALSGSSFHPSSTHRVKPDVSHCKVCNEHNTLSYVQLARLEHQRHHTSHQSRHHSAVQPETEHRPANQSNQCTRQSSKIYKLNKTIILTKISKLIKSICTILTKNQNAQY